MLTVTLPCRLLLLPVLNTKLPMPVKLDITAPLRAIDPVVNEPAALTVLPVLVAFRS